MKNIYLLIFGCSITVMFFALNYSGFCFREFRYLSSKEKIKSLFDIWNKSDFDKNKSVFDNIVIDGESKVLERKNRYANFDEFLEKHPNCCEVDPGGPYDMGAPFFIDRITGYDSGTVISFRFDEEFIDPDGNIITREVQILDRLQNCGESRW